MSDPKLRADRLSPRPQQAGFPSVHFRRLWPTFLGDRQAATAVEVALLLPVFLMFIFGILEVGLLLLYNLHLSTASNAGVEYLRRATVQHQQVTEGNLRQAIASKFIGGTDAENLKIALTPILDDDISAAPVSFPIVNKFQAPSSAAGQYILAVGYTWSFFMPTTRFLVPATGNVRQLKNLSLAITAVRVAE